MTVGSDVKQCFSSLKGVEASLSSLAIRTQENESKKTLHETMMVVNELVTDLKKELENWNEKNSNIKDFNIGGLLMPLWLNVISRVILFMVVLFFITKFLGKKQLSQLSFFEYVTGITIGGIAAIVILEVRHSIIIGGLAILVMAAIPYIVGLIALKSKKFRDFVEGKGSVFIKDGKIMEDNLKKERYTTDELLELLRKKDVYQVADVEFAVLEATGDLSVMLKKENQPLTAKDLNLTVASIKESQTVIMDGVIMDEPLATIGRSRAWLHTELEKLGVTVENVFLGQVNSYGELTVDLFDDQLQVASPQERPLILSTMKKCQADLELFALGTESKEAKQMYSKNSEKLQEAIDKVMPILKG